MDRPAKSSQLQIRVTARQKSGLQRRAAAAGLDMSAYVLALALPSSRRDFERCVAQCTDGEPLRFALAELHRLLRQWTKGELADAIEARPLSPPEPLAANYMAALIEQAVCCEDCPCRGGFAKSSRCRNLVRLAVTSCGCCCSPLSAGLRSRNLFVDSGLGSQL